MASHTPAHQGWPLAPWSA